MEITDVALDVAMSTKRPWADWTDGMWRRVPGLGTPEERESYARFDRAMRSWVNRNGYTGTVQRTPEGHVLFRLAKRAPGLEESEQYVIWRFRRPGGTQGWLNLVHGEVMWNLGLEKATRYSRQAAETILGLLGASRDGDNLPPAIAIPVSELGAHVPDYELPVLCTDAGFKETGRIQVDAGVMMRRGIGMPL